MGGALAVLSERCVKVMHTLFRAASKWTYYRTAKHFMSFSIRPFLISVAPFFPPSYCGHALARPATVSFPIHSVQSHLLIAGEPTRTGPLSLAVSKKNWTSFRGAHCNVKSVDSHTPSHQPLAWNNAVQGFQWQRDAYHSLVRFCSPRG